MGGGLFGDGNRGDVEGKDGECLGFFPEGTVSESPSQHRRCKSASDRNSDLARVDMPKYLQDDPNVSLSIMKKMGIHETQGPADQDPRDLSSCAASNHRASLENDIQQLQMRLRQEKSIRIMLEHALGRASSTLSPGHKHFSSKTRELISEIELLEEEVANREHQVLSLYRSIFDQCVSGAPSTQCSGTPSPSHAKTEGRKHPHVISSAFCSSRKFSLHSFQVLSSTRESGKKDVLLRPKTRYGSRSSGSIKSCDRSDIPMKVYKRVSTAGKSYIPYTPRSPLHHCPSKLSEELVRCMASIYCWECKDEIEDREKRRAAILSRSSTSIDLPRHGIGDDQDSSCRPMVEISWISTNKNRFSSTSIAIKSYRALVEQLERVDANILESKAKLAFWINMYNSLIMHAYLAYGTPHSSLRRISLFRKAAYNIGGQVISASTIEHSILGCHTSRVNRWIETIIWTAMRKKSGEEKQVLSSGFNLSVSQPLVCFALCTGASSDPVLKVYTAKHIEEELEMAKREFLQSNVIVKKSRKVSLPKLLDWYAKEASITTNDLLMWVCSNVDKKLQESIQQCINANSKKKASQIIEWSPYSTRFRYSFEKELTEKPWRV